MFAVLKLVSKQDFYTKETHLGAIAGSHTTRRTCDYTALKNVSSDINDGQRFIDLEC